MTIADTLDATKDCVESVLGWAATILGLAWTTWPQILLALFLVYLGRSPRVGTVLEY